MRFGLRLTFSMVVICIPLALLAYLFVGQHRELAAAPVGMNTGKNNGLWSAIFLDLILVNILIGIFASAIIGISARPNKEGT